MTDQEMRVVIAEWCGPSICVMNDEGDWIWSKGLGPMRYFEPLADLNAMHEAEEKLDDADQVEYVLRLNQVVRRGLPIGTGIFSWENLHATARQRAEALLRTIGKWKD